jgi:hypothetical protein
VEKEEDVGLRTIGGNMKPTHVLRWDPEARTFTVKFASEFWDWNENDTDLVEFEGAHVTLGEARVRTLVRQFQAVMYNRTIKEQE